MTPDEQLAHEGFALGQAILDSLVPWAGRVTEALLGPDSLAEGQAAGAAIATTLAPLFAELFAADVDHQRGTPLTLLRQAHQPLTDLLMRRGAQVLPRDEADTAANPSDVFGVAPRSFADLGEAVHEAGLRWGVAKAFAHRARHQ